MYIPETHLYKFFSEKSDYFEDAIKNLAEGNVWFSGIEHLNDPWEGVAPLESYIPYLMELSAKSAGYSDAGVGNLQQAPENILKLIRQKGIYCCSSKIEGRDPRRNKLLWSHYGNGGRGVCIEFRPLSIRSLPSGKVGIFHGGNVLYRKEAEPIGNAVIDFFLPNEGGVDKDRDLFDLALLQKPWCWNYEDEYRFISDTVGYVPLEKCPVSAIYFGPRAGEIVKCLLARIFSGIDGVRYFDTKIDGYELKIIEHVK